MPLLGGLFSKKSKSRSPNEFSQTGEGLSPQYSSAASELESSLSCTSVSPTTEFVSADKSLPSSPNGRRAAPKSVYPSAAASSSKLRLPFSRKKTSSAASLLQDPMSPPRPSYASRTSTVDSSETETSVSERRHLRPPPSRSAIFAAYGGDPRTAQQSTRSLPDERIHKAEPPSPPLPPLPQQQHQKRSLFNWYKSPPKSDSKLPTSTQRPDTSPASPDESFNLKSFRHVRPGSPTHSNISNTSLSNLPPPRPRPRGTSTASDSSQRISVAAFREAQARRSQAGSPAPSLRSQSPQVPPITNSKSYNGTETNRSSSNLSHYYTPTQSAQNKLTTRGSSVFADDSDTSASSSEEDESDDEKNRRSGGNPGVGRRRTLTQRSSNKAIAGKARATRSEMGHGAWGGDKTRDSPSSRPPSATLAPPRQRASVSTSASMPNAAAKRASILAANNELPSPAISSRHVRDSSVHTISASKAAPTTTAASDSDSDTDSDDAPLARLIPPRRPGSAMSNASGSRSNLSSSHTPVNRPAPLIDINTLTAKKPDAPFTVPRSKSTDVAFTGGATLLSGGRSSTSPTQLKVETSKRSGTDGPPPPLNFVLPPLELDDRSSRFVSSPTSMFSSSTGRTQPASTSSKSGSGHSERMASKEFPRRVESRESTSSSSRSDGGFTAPSIPAPREESPASRERRREGLNDRLTKVVKQTASPSTKDESVSPRHSGRGALSLSPPATPDSGIDYFSSGGSGGGGIRLVGGGKEMGVVNGEDKEQDVSEDDRIAPIVIKQRVPPSSFAVTSRPPHRNSGSSDSSRPRSTTLLPSNSPAPFSTNKATTTTSSSNSKPIQSPGTSPSSSFNLSTNSNANNNGTSGRSSPLMSPAPPGPRQRSSTMMPLGSGSPNVSMFPAPPKPFAKRTESPASSTGDSSSGRAPLTPRDGSEVGSSSAATSSAKQGGGNGKKEEWGSGVSGLALNGGGKGKGHMKRHSVTFEDQSELSGGKAGKNAKEKVSESPVNEEQRRKERRRSEAKAAIELGNVINGRGPIVDDDEDEDQPINQAYGNRMGMMNAMMPNPGMSMPMGMGPMSAGSPSWNPMAGWQQSPLMPAQFMPSPPSDPNFMAAHQQAMMIAKQAYQMAVAQQAMAAAADEWERSSSIGGFGGGSVYGGGSPSMNMGMGMGMGGWGGGGGMLFPPGPRSMYGGVAQSEYGGGGGGAGWGSKSVYGESFGPSSKETRRVSRGNLLQMKQAYSQRDSTYSIQPQAQSSSSTPSHGAPRARTTSTPASPGRVGGLRKAAPPSSWKAGL